MGRQKDAPHGFFIFSSLKAGSTDIDPGHQKGVSQW